MSSGLFQRLQDELDAQEKAAGLSMADVLALPDPLRNLVNWMIREQQVELTEIMEYADQDRNATASMLESLLEKGLVSKNERQGKVYYRIRLAPKRRREIPLNIWESMEKIIDQQQGGEIS
ncbi:MAG: hypothetical protein JW981_05370 [Anaerolineae bacterium]|nr:hypothetical protein [Anaerolineae bacterium]